MQLPSTAKLGPAHKTLQTGESAVNYSSKSVGRRGRKQIRVRIVGERSLGWTEAALGWGAVVEAITHNTFANGLVTSILSHPPSISVSQATRLPPRDSWCGILCSTCDTDQDFTTTFDLFKRWEPSIALIACPGNHARGWVTHKIKPFRERGQYSLRVIRSIHARFGGVTKAVWFMIVLDRLESGKFELMMAQQYERPLQSALFDTLGTVGSKPVFDPLKLTGKAEDAIIGHVRRSKVGPKRPVYSATGLGPDIGLMSPVDRYFWVNANTVWSKEKVVRKITTEELFAVWDYEGKLESSHWSPDFSAHMLSLRLQSPPAKIIRSFLYDACTALLPQDQGVSVSSESLDILPIGKTKDIKFSPLELQVEARLTAAMVDDRDADLSFRAMPNETTAQAEARQRLRSFACRWWYHNLEREANSWLASQPKENPRDREAVEDCLIRARYCTYFTWPRGTRLFFWRFPPEWRGDARDGVPFWRLSEPPKGMRRNIPSPSREVEILQRRKVFKLKLQWYIDHDYVSCVIPRFPVDKLGDIRIVWDCSGNGHNATLWGPGFMLSSFDDVENMVVKWLTMPVGQYLEQGSPVMNYNQEELGIAFIITNSADIDVGGMFHNFLAHISDRHVLGVRWYETCGDGSQGENCEFWRFNRLPFGGKCSPPIACMMQNRIIWLCKRLQDTRSSAFGFTRVHLNLPFGDYDPSLPRVIKLCADGEMASDEATYVDDVRVCGRGFEKTNRAARQLASGMNSYGNIADAAKYRPPHSSFRSLYWCHASY